ncbi:MAG: MATE family efflux transporter [Eubacteriales bacterium]
MLTRDRNFYKMFCALAGALMLEQAVVLSVNLADNVMIGNYGELSLAGVAAVNQVQFVIQQTVYGVNNGMIVLASQYWGKKQKDPIRKLSAIAVVVGLVMTLGMFLVASFWAEGLVGIFVKDGQAVAEGVRYLSIIRFTYPLFAVTTVLLGTMRSVENVKLALTVSCISLVLNCSINYALIGGNLGAPELGVVGAAIGTLTARMVELILVAFYVFKKDKKLSMKLSNLFHLDRTLLGDFARVGSPVIIAAVSWGVVNAIHSAILANMSVNAMTAYSVSSTIFLLLKVTSVGCATAASVIIGKQVGIGDMAVLKTYTKTLQLMFLAVGAILGTCLFFIRIPLLSMYNVSQETREMANTFMLIQCWVLFFMSYQMPVNFGIIRGGGNTSFAMWLDGISQWCIVIPLSLLAAFVFSWSPAVVVICLNSDQFFKGIPGVIWCNSYRWVKNLTRG